MSARSQFHWNRFHRSVFGIWSALSPNAQSTGAAQSQVTEAAQFQVMDLTVDDIEVALPTHRVTCRTIVTGYLKPIEAYNLKGPALNAVETVNSHTLAEADRLDEVLRASGPVGPLHCVPMLVKDELDTQDLITTYASRVFGGLPAIA